MHRSAWLDAVRDALWSQPSFSFIPNRDLPPPGDEVARSDGGTPVLFAGFPSDYSLAFLYELLRTPGIDVAGIVTSPGAHPAITGENALSRIASHCDIPLLRLWRVNDDHSRMDLAALRPEAVVMASFDQIVKRAALAIPAHGWLNVHPSLLPAYRGPEPVWWAIAEGATSTGITLHRAVAAFDAGPVLARAEVAIEPRDTAGTLTRRVCAAGVPLLAGALRRLLDDDPGEPLDPAAGSYRPSIGHRRLDAAASAAEAERWVRAGVPNMYAWADVDGAPWYVEEAEVTPGGGELRFADGCLHIVRRHPVCGCHHDREDCPHREG